MTDSKQLAEMLKHLGWGSGFRLPIANEENRRLEEMLEAKQTRLVQLSTEFQEQSLAVDKATSYYKHLQSKMQHAKDLENAKRGQIEKETHFLALAERDLAKSEQDAKKLDKHFRDLKGRNKLVENNVMRRKDSLAELVDIINFDKKAITAYEEKFSKEDAYMKLIDDFADTDNEKIKKCQVEYQVLGEKIATSKRQLDQTISETDIMDSELDALAKRFRKAHADRNQFIDNWKSTLENLEARDSEIMEMSNEYQSASVEMRKVKCMLERQEAFYENIKNQTRAYQIELSRLERKMNSMSIIKRQTESAVQESSDTVSELAAHISQVDKELASLRQEMSKVNDSMDKWEDKVQAAKDEIEGLRTKYDLASMENLTSSEHTTQLQDFYDNEIKRAELMSRELDKQITMKSQRERQSKELAEKVFLADSQTRNLQAAVANKRKECNEKADIIFKFHSVVYKQDLKVMDLVTKIRGVENPETLYSSEDYAHIQKKISRLQQTYDELLKAQNLIKSQCVHCEHVTFICQRELSKEEEQNNQYEIFLQKMQMEIRRIGKEEDATIDTIKDMGVTNSLLQVQLRKMLHSLQNYESKMFDLEQERVTLQAIVKARKKDIEVYATLLLGKKRGILDDSQKMRSKCQDLINEAQSRKRKYEMIMIQMWNGEERDTATNSGESGRSEAYFIIKMAQEREHYKQEGDKWDERVKEAETIVEGLQNTLALMIGTNEAFKDSLKPVAANTKESQQIQELKQKEIETALSLKVAKEKRSECVFDLEQKRVDLDKLISSRADVEHELMEKQYELQGLLLEINGQKDKIRRATLQSNKLVKELSKLEMLDTELLQTDLRLRVTKEKYEFGVATLERLLNVHPLLLTDTLEFLHSKGMEGLAQRIAMKMMSPSASASPSQSGRSTPYSSRSAAKRGVKLIAIGKSEGGTTSVRSHVKWDALSRTKSVAFEPPTGKSSAKKLLKNIRQGIETHNKEQKKLAKGSSPGTVAPRQTIADLRDLGPIAPVGISFGDLRKALQEAVADQAKQAQPQLSKVEEEPEHDTDKGASTSTETKRDSTDIVDLVDKISDFKED